MTDRCTPPRNEGRDDLGGVPLFSVRNLSIASFFCRLNTKYFSLFHLLSNQARVVLPDLLEVVSTAPLPPMEELAVIRPSPVIGVPSQAIAAVAASRACTLDGYASRSFPIERIT